MRQNRRKYIEVFEVCLYKKLTDMTAVLKTKINTVYLNIMQKFQNDWSDFARVKTYKVRNRHEI